MEYVLQIYVMLMANFLGDWHRPRLFASMATGKAEFCSPRAPVKRNTAFVAAEQQKQFVR